MPNINDNKSPRFRTPESNKPKTITATSTKSANATKAVKKKAVKKKAKYKKPKKPHPVLLTIFTVIFCLGVIGVLTGVTVGTHVLSYVNDFSTGKSVIDLDNYKNSQSQTSFIYVKNSEGKDVEELRLHGTENRIWVSYDQMPDNLTNAFVSLEDKRFYDHNGVDWIRTIGVFVNPKYDGQGGSTITQQLIKNLTGDNQTTYFRKFNEIVRALNLERYYSKKDILEAYLNTVYLGAGAYGVKTAAEVYFGKQVSELTLPECAMIAGVTKAPYTLNPYYDYDAAKDRQETCLWYMWQEGAISEKQYNKAKKAKINLVGRNNSSSSSEQKQEKVKIYSWYDEYVIEQVIADLQSKYDYEYNEAWRMVYYGGIKIYSAVDSNMQKTLEDIYKNRSGFPYSSRDKYGEYPNSAMTIMDYSGRVLALVGGTGEKTTNRAYNRATSSKAKRQPGSSIKPLSVYAPAVELGYVSPNSYVLEKAITVDGREWPRNFNGDHGSGGNITVQEALARSLNTVPARILKEMLTLDKSFEFANEKFHLNLSANDKTYSGLAVGGTFTGVTTLEMASAFATFANGGYYFKPYSYYKVIDRNGEVILDNTKNEGEQVISTKTANSCLSMMKAAVNQSNGTGYGSKISGFETFAKTGTTSDNFDKWYCGGTPYYVTAVWYGYDHPSNLHTGSSNPSKTIFHYVFDKLHRGLRSRTFKENLESLGLDSSGVKDVVLETTSESTTASEESSTSATSTTQNTTVSTTVSTTAATTAPSTTASTAPSTTEATTPAPSTTEAPTAPPTLAPEEGGE